MDRRGIAQDRKTDAAQYKNKDDFLALPSVECLPMESDVLFLGPAGKQQPFIVAERQYHHDGDTDWTIILILDIPHETH